MSTSSAAIRSALPVTKDRSDLLERQRQAEDPDRELDMGKVQKGWSTLQREQAYWVPECNVEGEIPKELDCTVFRNGPGNTEVFGTPLKHPIDGDGLVCAISFTHGRCHLRSRFVRHRARVEESNARKLLFRGQMGTTPHSLLHDSFQTVKAMVTGGKPDYKFRNPSNTNAFYWGGKVLSCYETGLPHSLDPATLETYGEDTLGGVLSLKAMAAHFRHDPKRDVLVVLSLRPGLHRSARVGFYEFDRNWQLLSSQEFPVEGLNYAHDFLLTEHHYIVHMSPFVKITKAGVMRIAMGLDSPADQMHYYPDLPSRMVVLPRRGGTAMSENPRPVRQFDCIPCHIYHFGTVVETLPTTTNTTTTNNNNDNDNNNSNDPDKARLQFTAVCLGKKFNMQFENKMWLSNASAAPGLLHRFDIDMATGTCESTLVDPASCEFPAVHPFRHGLPAQYNYVMANDREGQNLPYRDIVKYSMATNQREVWRSGGCVGEPIFIPRQPYPAGVTQGAEDDGWLFVQVFHPESSKTHLVLLDAQRLSQGPVCTIRLQHQIPNGFHGTMVRRVWHRPPGGCEASVGTDESSSITDENDTTTNNNNQPTLELHRNHTTNNNRQRSLPAPVVVVAAAKAVYRSKL